MGNVSLVPKRNVFHRRYGGTTDNAGNIDFLESGSADIALGSNSVVVNATNGTVELETATGSIVEKTTSDGSANFTAYAANVNSEITAATVRLVAGTNIGAAETGRQFDPRVDQRLLSSVEKEYFRAGRAPPRRCSFRQP